MKVRQCSSCGGFCKKSGCERANVYADRAAQQERKPMTREQRELLLRKADTLDGIVLAVEAFHGIKETP